LVGGHSPPYDLPPELPVRADLALSVGWAKGQGRPVPNTRPIPKNTNRVERAVTQHIRSARPRRIIQDVLRVRA